MVTNKYIYFSLLCSLTVLLPACTDDAESDNRAMMLSRSINFTTGSPQSWNAEGDSVVTRSALFSMNGDNGDELPVRLEVKSGIEGKGLTSATNTRGLAYNNSSSTLYSTVGVFTYSYDAAWLSNNYTTFTPFMNNVCATENSAVYVPQQKYYWDDVADKLIRTFLYSPHSSLVNTESKNYLTTKLSVTTTGLPQLVYEIPAEADEQPDLLAGYSIIDDLESTLRENPWDVSFHHILSAIRVKIGSDFPDGTIKSISLKNVYKNGTYTFGCKYNNASTGVEQTRNDQWSLGTYANTVFTQELDFDAKTNKDVLIIDGDKTWMMLPQTLSSNTTYPATLELTFQKDGSSEENTYKCLLRSFTTSWVMGKTYTYKISDLNDTDYTFEIAALNDYEYTGGSQTMQITSYKTLTNVNTGTETKQAVSWNITQYSTDGTSYSAISGRPTYLGLSATNGTGNISTYNSVTTTMQALTPTYTADPVNTSTDLSSATYISTRRDLSMYDVMGNSTSRNTANCYVVRAPGLYKIPCVYGNAIKNGSTNSAAYTSTASGTTILTPFVNGNNVGITDPWLKNCGATPTAASIVWQDAENLIRSSSVSLSTESGNQYVYFEIQASDIQQGNAVLAVQDASGNTQWSWHIWVTAEDFTSNQKTVNSGTLKNTTPTSQDYTLMSVPLGSVVGSATADFVARDIWIKVVQTDSNEEKIVQLHQKGLSGQTVEYHGAAYYQFGRKDPFPIQDVTGYTGSPRTGSFNWSTYQYTYNRDEAKLYEGIRNPGTLYGGSGTFGSSYWFEQSADCSNLWDADGDYISGVYPLRNTQVVKTIYDPSPAGWHVPECGAFGRWNNITTITYTPTSNCYLLTNNSSTYTLPVLGYRNESDGTLTKQNVNAVFWTAACESTSGRNLCVSPNSSGGYTSYITAYVVSSGAMDYTVTVPGVSGYAYSKASALNIIPVKDY